MTANGAPHSLVMMVFFALAVLLLAVACTPDDTKAPSSGGGAPAARPAAPAAPPGGAGPESATAPRVIPPWDIRGSEAGDYRSLVRVFNEASELTTTHPDFQALLLRLAELVGEVRPGSRKLAMTMHQVSIFAEAGEEGDNSPEGVHQDGADYIVSALVVERDGVIGAESIVYGADKKTEILRHTLQPGEGLFQADKNTSLWHDVTLIQDDPATPPTYGKRSIFGFDINVVD